METEFERFRIDPAVRDQAAHVCGRLGHELSDVLRALVVRIARDGAIPFEMPAAAPPRTTGTLLSDDRLWGGLRPQVEAEVALDLLARVIADCSTALDEQRPAEREQITQLTEQRDYARRLRRELDVTDPAAVRAVLQQYGPLARVRKS
jgi:antitoxin component of RelBE/YafQ-DinJ toxin-antitoxin module